MSDESQESVTKQNFLLKNTLNRQEISQALNEIFPEGSDKREIEVFLKVQQRMYINTAIINEAKDNLDEGLVLTLQYRKKKRFFECYPFTICDDYILYAHYNKDNKLIRFF